jgi:MSHA biogenesis protein MshG
MKKVQNREQVIYGVTDRSHLSVYETVNDFLIDHSPITSKERSLFFNSLRLLVKSGVPVINALRMLARRTQNIRLRRVLDTIEYDLLQNGSTLSQAMSKHPGIFPRSEVRMIYSGELSGKLEEVLDQIAEQVQKNIELEQRVRSALMYPVIVLCVIVLAVIVVMMFVVPKFESMFSEFGSELPMATKILIGTSNFFQNYWWFVCVMVAAAWFIFQNWIQSEKGSRSWDQWIHSLPGIGILIRNIHTVRLAHNAGAMLSAGLPLEKSLRVLHDVLTSPCQQDAILAIEHKVRQGMLLHKAFEEQEILDPVLAEMVEIGEKTGSLAEVFLQIGDQYETEVDVQLKNLTQLVEPIIIVFVGLAVVFLAMAIMTPVFQMQSLFAG